jgi:Fur family transcriptional regulator, ferric uptake regulator
MNMEAHCHRSKPEMPELTDRLRRESHKITGPRQAILGLLHQHPHPMTNKEVFEHLPPGHCDLATVYRSMRLLETMGIVKRFDFGDGVARYELVSEAVDDHHHHLICTNCSHVVEIEDCFPVELEQRIASRNGFQFITHKLEFFGICPKCQGKRR